MALTLRRRFLSYGDRKGTIWILDAKNAHPTNDQLHKMQAQIRLLQKEPDITKGRPITGVIVYRKRQLENPIQPTEHHNILRCTIQRLPDLLLAKRLPGHQIDRSYRARPRTGAPDRG